MTKITVKNQTQPTTPPSGKTRFWIDSSTKTIKTIDDAGVVRNYALSDTNTIPALSTLPSTTVIDGCLMSINAIDNTKFDISSGTIIFSDAHIDPTDVTLTVYEYPGATGLSTPYLSTLTETFVALDSTGTPYYHAALDGTDNDVIRTYAPLGLVIHTNKTIIDSVFNGCGCTFINVGSTLADLAVNLGFINMKNGNVYSAAATNLEIQKSDGYVFGFGLNKTNKSNPNVIHTPSLSPCNISYTFRDGLGGFKRGNTVTSIVPNKYDDGTGGTTVPNGVVGANEWTVQYLYFTGAFTVIHYGQHKYQSQADAVSAINLELLTENTSLANSLFRAWLVIKGSTTNLSDITQAQFFTADKFGTKVLTGGVPTNSTTMQGAYKNSIEPEIKITPTRGAVVIQDADVATGGNLIEIKTSSGTATPFSVSASQITLAKKLRLSGDGICYDDLKVSAGLRAASLLPPDFIQLTGLGNVYLYAFDLTKVEQLFGTVQMPHKWKEGTDIVPHIHWCTADGNAGNIIWGIEYTWANKDGTFSTTTTQEITVANSTAYKHRVNDFPTISGLGKTISSLIMIRLFRNGASGADTYGSDAYLLDFDLHYQIDSIGSDGITSKT